MNKEQRKLVEDNIKLVYFTILKFYPRFLSDEDIIQCGMLGLCKAASNYDSSKSKFSTFATTCIKNEISFELRNRKKHSNNISFEQLFERE